MIRRVTLGYVVAIAEPEYVDGLGLVVHAEPAAECTQVRLNGARAQAEQASRAVMRARADVGSKDLNLPLGGS